MVKVLLTPSASRRTVALRTGQAADPLPTDPIELAAVPAAGSYVEWDDDGSSACVELVLYRAGDPVVEVQVGV